jgi:ketosteroid isomerase-like protein
MLSWLGKQVLSYTMKRLRAGDAGPSLRMESDDIRMVFPGTSSFAADVRSKAEHERWLARFTRLGLQIFPDEVIVKGFPWNTTVCIRGTDHLDTAQGERVYENRYVIWGKMSWGKLTEYEVYEDTQKTEAFDRWLTEHESALAA